MNIQFGAKFSLVPVAPDGSVIKGQAATPDEESVVALYKAYKTTEHRVTVLTSNPQALIDKGIRAQDVFEKKSPPPQEPETIEILTRDDAYNFQMGHYATWKKAGLGQQYAASIGKQSDIHKVEVPAAEQKPDQSLI